MCRNAIAQSLIFGQCVAARQWARVFSSEAAMNGLRLVIADSSVAPGAVYFWTAKVHLLSIQNTYFHEQYHGQTDYTFISQQSNVIYWNQRKPTQETKETISRSGAIQESAKETTKSQKWKFLDEQRPNQAKQECGSLRRSRREAKWRLKYITSKGRDSLCIQYPWGRTIQGSVEVTDQSEKAMASNLIAMASNLIAMASNLIGMMASNLLAMASNLIGTASPSFFLQSTCGWPEQAACFACSWKGGAATPPYQHRTNNQPHKPHLLKHALAIERLETQEMLFWSSTKSLVRISNNFSCSSRSTLSGQSQAQRGNTLPLSSTNWRDEPNASTGTGIWTLSFFTSPWA